MILITMNVTTRCTNYLFKFATFNTWYWSFCSWICKLAWIICEKKIVYCFRYVHMPLFPVYIHSPVHSIFCWCVVLYIWKHQEHSQHNKRERARAEENFIRTWFDFQNWDVSGEILRFILILVLVYILCMNVLVMFALFEVLHFQNMKIASHHRRQNDSKTNSS